MTKFSGKGKTQTNEKLIKKFMDKKIIHVLAVYHIMKQRFNNGVLYNYEPSKLASILNISEKRVIRIIDLAIENNLCEKQLLSNGTYNLRFLSINAVKQNHNIVARHKCTIFVQKESTIQEVEDQLLLKLIEQQQRQELFINQKKASTQINVIELKDSNVEKSSNIGRLKNSKNVVGYRKLAFRLGMSHTFVWNAVKRLKKRGFLKTTTVTEAIKKISYKEYLHTKKYLGNSFDGHVFYKKGFLNTCLGTIFEFKAFPTKATKNTKIKLSKQAKTYANTIAR